MHFRPFIHSINHKKMCGGTCKMEMSGVPG